MQGLWAELNLIFPQHVTRGWVHARGKEVGGEEEEGVRSLNRQENEKSVLTNAYVPLTGLQMLISHSPVFYLCTSPLDIFIFKYILLKYS